MMVCIVAVPSFSQVESQQLFWHKKELTSKFDGMTLLDMNMHTGFALQGYDTVSLQCCNSNPSTRHRNWQWVHYFTHWLLDPPNLI